MGSITGDASHLQAAAAAMKPDVSEAQRQSRQATAAAQQAAAAAGKPQVGAAIDSLASALAKAIGDTATSISQMGTVTSTEGRNFETVGAGG
jgi:hypothetical protein